MRFLGRRVYAGLVVVLITTMIHPMLTAETTEGLGRLGILHETTLPYAPFQNGKQEAFWNGVNGRLLPMLERSG